MKKITSLLLVLSVILSLATSLTSCADKPPEDAGLASSGATHGTEEGPGDTVVTEGQEMGSTEDQDVIPHIPTATQLENTGDIPYDYFARSLYNSYRYGNYGEYLEAELFPFKYDNKFGYADANGQVIIPEQFEKAGYFSENKAFVKKDGQWSVIDTAGNRLYTLTDYEDSIYSSWDQTLFQNGRAIMVDNIDPSGHGLETATFETTLYVLTGDFVFSVIPIDLTYKAEIRVVNTPEFAGFLSCHRTSEPDKTENTGYRYSDVYTLYDLSGAVVWSVSDVDQNAQSKYHTSAKHRVLLGTMSKLDVFIICEGCINVPDADDQWGLFDIATKTYRIDCAYEYVGGISEGLVPVSRYGKWGYVDTNGVTKIEPTFGYATDHRNGRAFVITQDNKPVVIDTKGNIIARYDIRYWPEKNYRIFRPSANSDITVVTYGDDIYHTDNGGFLVPDIGVYILDHYGNTLVVRAESEGVYVSDSFVFIGPDAMFAID